MSNDNNDDNQGVVWAVLIGAVVLAVGLAVGVGLKRTGSGGDGMATAVATAAPAADAAAGAGAADSAAGAGSMGAAPSSTADMTNGQADAAGIRIEGGVVKFFFASASAELASGAPEALAEVVKGVAAGQTAVISGFHDTTGDPVKNEELAKQRALAVRDALLDLGIGEDKVELKKPEAADTSSSNAEARRVEVSLQ